MIRATRMELTRLERELVALRERFFATELGQARVGAEWDTVADRARAVRLRLQQLEHQVVRRAKRRGGGGNAP